MNRILKVLISFLLISFSATAFAKSDTYKIDHTHSGVRFDVLHLGFSVLTGRFNDIEGDFVIDEKNDSLEKINVKVKVHSIDSNHVERDQHLRHKDFLHARKYPESTFVSKSVKGTLKEGVLKGDLTLHGVTKPVSIAYKKIGSGADPWGGYRFGFKGTTTIKCSDFGIGGKLGPESDPVDLHIFIEGIKKK